MALNGPQGLLLAQARSDHDIYARLLGQHQCHRLHYIQMCTEKLGKVYAWRNNACPPNIKTHFFFVAFLNDLEVRPDYHTMFGFSQAAPFNPLRLQVKDLASRIEALVPAGKNNGPNPEYPWPPTYPNRGPASESFPEWTEWTTTRYGLALDYFVMNMLVDYETYYP